MVNAAVISVNLYIIFIVVSQWLLIYQPLEIGSGQIGYLFLIMYHFLVFILYFSYWKAIVTPPGHAPNDWLPEGKSKDDLNILIEQYSNPFNIPPSKSTSVYVDDIQSSINNNNSNSTNDDNNINSINSSNSSVRSTNLNNNNSNSKSLRTRFCTQCKIFKPPRSHHCKVCKKCVLKQDHHCPWIDNCTGFRNQKFFLLFLFYVVIVGSITIVSLVISGFYILNFNLKVTGEESDNSTKFVNLNQKTTLTESSEDQIPFMIPGAVVTILFILNLSSVIPVVLGVLGLFFYQIDFLLSNYTSVERFERKSLSKYAKKNKLNFHWKYDGGVKRNFKEVFGESKLYWLIPTGVPKSDGTFWKTFTYEDMQYLFNKDSKDSIV